MLVLEVANDTTAAVTAPWWGVPVIAGGFLIIGGLLGFWFNRIQDTRKAKREDLRKWDDRILELTTDIISKVDTFNGMAIMKSREADGRRVLLRDGLLGDDDKSTPLEEVRSFTQVAELFIQVIKACMSLELIAPAPVRNAAVAMRSVELSTHPESGYEAMAPMIAELDDKRKALERTVREHFGLE